MTEVFLDVEVEEGLKRHAIDQILLSFMIDYIENSSQPDQIVDRIRVRAKGLSRQGGYSENEETAEYARRHLEAVIEAYFDRFKLKRS